MGNQHDKNMTDLARLMQEQNINSKEELAAFIQNLMGSEIPSMPASNLNKKQKAEDLIFEAYNMDPSEALECVDLALQLDPDCIMAYEFLATSEEYPRIANVFYEKAISIGRRVFGGKYLKENKGMFWGLIETRPYMRCLQQYAECLYAMGDTKSCIAIYEELIGLNPNDNQGVRDQLMLFLLELNDFKKFDKYSKMYPVEIMCFSVFNRLLYLYKTTGDSPETFSKLKEAMQVNKFVVTKLLKAKPVLQMPNEYSLGSKEEADYYMAYALPVWSSTPGALFWLKTNAVKK